KRFSCGARAGPPSWRVRNSKPSPSLRQVPEEVPAPVAHPVTITIDTGHPGPVVPADFAGLSFERGPLNRGNAGVAGYLFNPGNNSLITLFRNLGPPTLRLSRPHHTPPPPS